MNATGGVKPCALPVWCIPSPGAASRFPWLPLPRRSI